MSQKKTCVREKLKCVFISIVIIGSFSFGAAAAVLSMCDPSFNSPSFQHTENNQFKLYIVTFQEQKIVERCFEDFNSSILKLLAPTVTGYIEKKLKKKSKKSISCLFVQTSLCKAKSSKVGLEASVRHSKQLIQLEMIFTTLNSLC